MKCCQFYATCNRRRTYQKLLFRPLPVYCITVWIQLLFFSLTTGGQHLSNIAAGWLITYIRSPLFPSGAQFTKHKCTCSALVKIWNRYFLHDTNNLVSVALLKHGETFLAIKGGKQQSHGLFGWKLLGSFELRLHSLT